MGCKLLFKLAILGVVLIIVLAVAPPASAQESAGAKESGDTASGFSAKPVDDTELAATSSPSPSGVNVSPTGAIGGSAATATGANRVDTPSLATSSVRGGGTAATTTQGLSLPPSVVQALGDAGINLPGGR